MPSLSVIIPTLNVGEALEQTLTALRTGDCDLVHEIIVSDGGSQDQTFQRAVSAGCVFVRGASGRGNQLARGATNAKGHWLLFIHADTCLSENWGEQVRDFIGMKKNQDQAAVFKFVLDDVSRKARVLEAIVATRVRLLALPYGDQGLLISRAFYCWLGGFSPIPLMEDVEMARKIGRARLHVLPALAVTSASRYMRDGYIKRMGRNAICLSLYTLGVSPHWLAKFYN